MYFLQDSSIFSINEPNLKSLLCTCTNLLLMHHEIDVVHYCASRYGVSDRLKSIADSFANHGYHSIVVDCFHGETADKNSNGDVMGWIGKFPWSLVSRDLHAAGDFLQGKGVEKNSIAAIGFCWGGWAIAKSSAEGFCWKCAVSPHPSTKIERFVFGSDESAMLGKVNMPFLLMPAGDDEDNVKPGSEEVKTLESKGGGSVLFDRMKHGFVTRGDLNEADVKEDTEKALALILEFIDKNFTT